MVITEQLLHRTRPSLLVSVRNAEEALAALAGGADVIDVKEPNRGPLGAAERRTIADVVRVVDGRVPVTAAAGELVELLPAIANNSCQPMPDGVSLVKIGLAHCATLRNWTSQWRTAIAALQSGGELHHALPVAVVYADWRAAAAPAPDEIHSAAMEIGCPVVLIDTWEKSAGTLVDHWPPAELKFFVERVRGGGLAVVLAGSLSSANLLAVAELRPEVVAVRGAVCDAGRGGHVSRQRVEKLRQALETATKASGPRGASGRPPQKSVSLRHKEFS